VPDLLDAIGQEGVLDPPEMRKLKQLLFKMSMVETSVAAGRPMRVREQDVQIAAQHVDHVLACIDQKGRNR
jgi:hypothetical protein